MYIINYTASNFNVNNCKEYILSIQISLNGLSFLLFSETTKNIIFFRKKEFDIYNEYQLLTEVKYLFEKESLLQNSFKKVKVFFSSKNFIFTPEGIFNSDNAEELLSLSTQINRNQKALSTYHKASRSYITYPVNTSLLDIFENHFTNVQFFSSWNTILELGNLYIKQNLQKNKIKYLFAHLYDNKIYLHIQDNDQLIFANCFTTKNTKDDVYYILNCFKSNQLDQKTDQIVISGKTKEKGNIIADLKKFIQSVSLLELNNYAIPEAIINDQPRHYYFRHIISALCE